MGYILVVYMENYFTDYRNEYICTRCGKYTSELIRGQCPICAGQEDLMDGVNNVLDKERDEACKTDDCEQYHCPECGGHTLGWLDTFEKCDECKLKEEHMEKQIVVVIDNEPGSLSVFRHNTLIAKVREIGGKPNIYFLGNTAIHYLSFEEIGVVMDNWDQMEEINNLKELTSWNESV